MIGIPYLKPPHVWPIRRCYFEFHNAETASGTEIYRFHRRYRFNKWQPLYNYTPTPTHFGLQFIFSDHHPLSGVVSSFVVPANESCTAAFTFSKMDFNINPSGPPLYSWLPAGVTPNPVPPTTRLAEVGLGILRYDSPYWGAMGGMELAIRRGPTYIQVTGLRSEPIQLWSSPNLQTSAKFEARIDGATGELHVAITEFDATGAATGTPRMWSAPMMPPDAPLPGETEEPHKYRFVMFGRAVEGSCDTLLARSELTNYSRPFWGSQEFLPFVENPETFNIVDGSPRQPETHIYPQPHIAYVEDGDIQCSSVFCDEQWFNILTMLIDSTVEPFFFYDIEGRQWLCCFEDLTGAGRRGYLGRHRNGYSLSMPILVVH